MTKTIIEDAKPERAEYDQALTDCNRSHDDGSVPDRRAQALSDLAEMNGGLIGEAEGEKVDALREHFKAMQRMATAYLMPEDYRDRNGKITHHGDHNNTEQWKQGQRGFRAEAFANDMVYMLDGPEERAALATPASPPAETGEKRFGGETATEIVKRWADWINDVSNDMDDPEWGGKTRNDVLNERDFVIRSLSRPANSDQSDTERMRAAAMKAEVVLTRFCNGYQLHPDIDADAENALIALRAALAEKEADQ